MNGQKIKFVLVFLLLGFSILACNFQSSTLPQEQPPSPSLTPLPEAEFQLEAPFGESSYFLEEFSAAIPDDWIASNGWNLNGGMLSTSTADALLEIPGEWQEMRLILLFKIRSGSGALDFNVSPAGAYRLTLGWDQISLSWQAAQGDPVEISSFPAELSADWHTLILDQTQGSILIELDQETLFSGIRPDYSPSGSLRLINRADGWLEIDRLVVGPPGY